MKRTFLILTGALVWMAWPAAPAQAQSGSATPPANKVAAAPTGDASPYIQAIEQASDPSALVAAYAAGYAADRTNLKLHDAYVSRMVQFGVPEMAYHQAQLVAGLDPRNGLAQGVLAYVDAKRGRHAGIAVGDRAGGRPGARPRLRPADGRRTAGLVRPELPERPGGRFGEGRPQPDPPGHGQPFAVRAVLRGDAQGPVRGRPARTGRRGGAGDPAGGGCSGRYCPGADDSAGGRGRGGRRCDHASRSPCSLRTWCTSATPETVYQPIYYPVDSYPPTYTTPWWDWSWPVCAPSVRDVQHGRDRRGQPSTSPFGAAASAATAAGGTGAASGRASRARGRSWLARSTPPGPRSS